MNDAIWSLEHGAGPVIATAIHDGHDVRDEVAELLALDDSARLREEDPYTGYWTSIAATRVIGTRSRFEVDLNRPRDSAIYRTPEDAWGLDVWNGRLSDEVAARSLEEYEAFYAALGALYREKVERYGRILVLDLHSYNYRREGPDGPPADPADNPQVNVGTGTMLDRSRWEPMIDRFMGELMNFDFPGGRLDVRENVRFRGGACAAWAHRTFSEAACVLSIEIKKFFMDEWTGEANKQLLDAIREALGVATLGAVAELEL